MTQRLKAFVLCVALIGALAATVSGFERVGAIFDLGASARGLGLGGAYSALVDDEGATLHNPAALGWYEGVGLSSLVVEQFGGVLYARVGITAPWFGVDVVALDSGPIPGDAGTFRYASQGAVASVGVPIGPLGIGLRWRLLRTSGPTSGSGWSIDPALLLVADPVRASLVVEGAFSQPIAYESGAAESWPLMLRLGAALTLSPSDAVQWNLAFEADGLFGDLPRFGVGLEAWIADLGARVGYDGRGATFGLSVRLAGLQIDWAYAVRDDLGDSHRVSVAFRF